MPTWAQKPSEMLHFTRSRVTTASVILFAHAENEYRTGIGTFKRLE